MATRGEPDARAFVVDEHIQPIADQLVHQHFPETFVLLVDVVGDLIFGARELAQFAPVVAIEHVAQAGFVVGRGPSVHHALRSSSFKGSNT